MYAILLAVVAVLGTELLPIPTGDDLAKAEKTAQEVFGEQLRNVESAAPTSDRRNAMVELAQNMLETAAGSDPAGRYVLLQRARDLAADAGDSSVGIQAIQELVSQFVPKQPQEWQAYAREGHQLWNKGKDLKTRLTAAECYMRCLDNLEGIQKVVVEKRLRELGWKPGPIDFSFAESEEGWTARKDVADLEARDGYLTGRVTGADPQVVCQGLEVVGERCSVIEIRMRVTAGQLAQLFWTTEQSPSWTRDKTMSFPISDNGQFHVYRLRPDKHPTWSGVITGLRIDPGDSDHGSKQGAQFMIDYVWGKAH